MVQLSRLLQGLKNKKIYGNKNLKINKVSYNSNLIEQNDLFIAIKGLKVDGHNYIQQAIERGASAVVSEKKINLAVKTLIVVPDSRTALARIACNYFNNPSRDLEVVGVTGTNGKTTTAFLIKRILEEKYNRVGLIGTIANYIAEQKLPTKLTTPESLELQALFVKMRKDKVKAVSMEVSSHSLELNRVYGVDFDCAVFTNLTRDHLDFHRTLTKYKQAKAKLFQNLNGKDKFAVLNLDDPHWKYFYQKTKVKKITYSINSHTADFYPLKFSWDFMGIRTVLQTPAGQLELSSQLLGKFNLYNILASTACAWALGISLNKIKSAIEAFSAVEGRIEPVKAGQPFRVIIDYAHTPDALKTILETVGEINKGTLWVVFGCGGDRDKGKRPLMGQIAVELADKVVVTSDNPRTEEPDNIIQDILAGIKEQNKVWIIPDRRQAISKALEQLHPDDSLVIAGKGHEDYQVIGTRRFPFSDREIVIEKLKQLGFSQN